MAYPDNREDNVVHLQKNITNTFENLREAEDFLKAHQNEMNSQDRQDIEAKNERRRHAIEGFRSEIQDEVQGTPED